MMRVNAAILFMVEIAEKYGRGDDARRKERERMG